MQTHSPALTALSPQYNSSQWMPSQNKIIQRKKQNKTENLLCQDMAPLHLRFKHWGYKVGPRRASRLSAQLISVKLGSDSSSARDSTSLQCRSKMPNPSYCQLQFLLGGGRVLFAFSAPHSLDAFWGSVQECRGLLGHCWVSPQAPVYSGAIYCGSPCQCCSGIEIPAFGS